MDTGYFARRDEVLQDTVRLDHDMLLITDLDLSADKRIDKRQFGQFAVKEVRQRFAYLLESRFLDKHTVEHAVGRIGVRVLLDTAAGERSVTDIHGEQQVVHRLFAVHGKDHMLRLMLHDGADETEDIVHMMRTDIVFERLRFLAAEGIDAETDGVDEIAVMLDAVAPIGDATDIDRMTFALEETLEALFMILGQTPEPSPVVTRTARHETDPDLRPLLRRQVGTHDAVDGFGEGAVAAENKDLVVSFLHQFTRQLDGMAGELGNTISERLMPFAQ